MTISPRLYVVAAGLCLAVSIALARMIPVLFGTPEPLVHVIWRDADRLEREALEQRFHLSEAADLQGGRWAYVPLDTTREGLKRLVAHPKVAATDGIDRNLFQIAKRGPLTARRGGIVGPVAFVGGLLKLIVNASAAAACGLLLLAAATLRGWSLRDLLRILNDGWPRDARAMRSLAPAASSLLGRGIPVASAEAAGVFRIVFWCLVVAYLVKNPVYPALLEPYELGRAAGAYGGLMRWLAEHSQLVAWLDPSIKLVGSSFILGFATPLAYPAFVALFLLWASVFTLQTSHHVVAALGIALVCLLPARWADAWSIDAWLRWRAGGVTTTPASTRYGFAMWVPVLVFGVTLAAAAASKLRDGLDWILNGTVKYHFISDLEHAWVSWGPRIAQHDAIAVTLSATVVVLEALVLTAAFSRSDRYKLTIGLGAAMMLAGFAVLQGIVWPGWWILLVGFLPWHRIRGASVASAAHSMSLAQRLALCTFVLAQIYVSSARIEARPIVSAYDMYSTTYASDEDYERASNLRYRIVALMPGGTTHELGCDIDDEAARVLAIAGRGGSSERLRMRRQIAACLKDRPEVEFVTLEGDRQVFDWNTGTFVWKRRVDHIGPVPVRWLWN